MIARARATRRILRFGWVPDRGRNDATVPSHSYAQVGFLHRLGSTNDFNLC